MFNVQPTSSVDHWDITVVEVNKTGIGYVAGTGNGAKFGYLAGNGYLLGLELCHLNCCAYVLLQTIVAAHLVVQTSTAASLDDVSLPPKTRKRGRLKGSDVKSAKQEPTCKD